MCPLQLVKKNILISSARTHFKSNFTANGGLVHLASNDSGATLKLQAGGTSGAEGRLIVSCAGKLPDGSARTPSAFYLGSVAVSACSDCGAAPLPRFVAGGASVEMWNMTRKPSPPGPWTPLHACPLLCIYSTK